MKSILVIDDNRLIRQTFKSHLTSEGFDVTLAADGREGVEHREADRVGRPLTLVLVQASLGLSMLLWLAAGGYPALALFALWMGLSYGGIVSLMPALCMDLFGARAVSSKNWQISTASIRARSSTPVASSCSTSWVSWPSISITWRWVRSSDSNKGSGGAGVRAARALVRDMTIPF